MSSCIAFFGHRPSEKEGSLRAQLQTKLQTWNYLLPLTIKAAAVVQWLWKLAQEEEERLDNMERGFYLHKEIGRWAISAASSWAAMLWQRTRSQTNQKTHMLACTNIHPQKDVAKWSDNPPVWGGDAATLIWYNEKMFMQLMMLRRAQGQEFNNYKPEEFLFCVCVYCAPLYVTIIRFWWKPPPTKTNRFKELWCVSIIINNK